MSAGAKPRAEPSTTYSVATSALRRLMSFAALVALVSARVLVPAKRTHALHEPVGEKALALAAEQLLHDVLRGEPVVVDRLEHVLRNLCLLLRGRATKMIEANIEPLVDALVKLIVLVTDLLRRQTLLNRLGLGSRTILHPCHTRKGVV